MLFKAYDSPQAALGFVVSQLAHIEQRVWEAQYPEITYPQNVPVDNSASPWTKTVTYFSTDKVGKTDWINGRAGDVPLVGLNRQKFETEVHMQGVGFDYTLEEINQARQAGINLTDDLGKAARRAYEETCQRIAYVGDAPKGFSGLLNTASVTAATVANGAASSPLWTSKTPDEILADFNTGLTGIWTTTLMIAMADTVLLPPAKYAYLVNTRLNNLSQMTLLSWIKENNIYTQQTGRPLNIRALNECTGAGSGGTDRMVFYRNSDEVLKMHIPMSLTFIAPQPEGFRVIVPGMFRLGGVDVRLPKQIRYYDGF